MFGETSFRCYVPDVFLASLLGQKAEEMSLSGGREHPKSPCMGMVGTSRLKVSLRYSKSTCSLKWLGNHIWEAYGSPSASNSFCNCFPCVEFPISNTRRVIRPFLEWPPQRKTEKISFISQIGAIFHQHNQLRRISTPFSTST